MRATEAESGDSVPSPDSAPPDSSPTPLALTVIGCAYNEQANVQRFLQGCLEARGPSFALVRLVLVMSGCTDGTELIARRVAREDARVLLVVQPTRLGKAAALNEGLLHAEGDVTLIEGVDTSPEPGAIEEIIRPLRDPSVSVVCGRPVPMGDSESFVAQVSRTMWAVHHLVSLRVPKAGEAYAIRTRHFVLPVDIQDDDTYLAAMAVLPGTHSVYAPTAVFRNRVPSTPADYLRQRWRINHQELNLRRSTGVESVTWRPALMASALRQFVRENPGSLRYVTVLALAESVARVGAYLTSSVSRQPLTQWAPIQSTKDRLEIGTGPLGSPKSPNQ